MSDSRDGILGNAAYRTDDGALERLSLAGTLVRPITDHNALAGDDAGADDWVGRGAPEATARVLERPPHPPRIRFGQGSGGQFVYHLFWNSAST